MEGPQEGEMDGRDGSRRGPQATSQHYPRSMEKAKRRAKGLNSGLLTLWPGSSVLPQASGSSSVKWSL